MCCNECNYLNKIILFLVFEFYEMLKDGGRKLKLPKSKKQSLAKRFKNQMSDEEMQTIAKGFVPPNRQNNTSWALAVFNEWRLARNMKCTTDKCPEELFEECNIGQLNR